MATKTYSYRKGGSVGCEIINVDGEIVAWTISEVLAAVIVKLLNEAEFSHLIQ